MKKIERTINEHNKNASTHVHIYRYLVSGASHDTWYCMYEKAQHSTAGHGKAPHRRAGHDTARHCTALRCATDL